MTKKEERELKKLEYKIEVLRSKIDERRGLLAFENAFFLPLFVLLLFVSYWPTLNEVKIFLFVLTLGLIGVDIVYSIVLYYNIKHKQNDLEAMIRKRSEF